MSISPAKLADSLTQLQQLFTKADKSGNGSLSQTEFASAASGVAGLSGASAADTSNLFSRMDTNGDGELSKTELSSGIKLAEQVQKALLMAQELMSGSTLMNMIGGSTASADSSAANMFSSGTDDSAASSTLSSTNLASILSGNSTGTDQETSSTDAYTSQLQQIIAQYNATAQASIDSAKTSTTVSQSV